MEASHRESAAPVRSRIERRDHDPRAFREALGRVPPRARDAWVDAVLGLDEVADDGPGLPRGCVPYFPSSVDVLVRVVDQARVGPDDVFVDVGAGPGRAAAFVHLLTGAAAVGVEVQPALVGAARALAARLGCASRLAFVEGEAAELAASVASASVFFLYCPFGGERLETLLARLEPIARTRPIRVCCVDLPLPPCPWLAPEPQVSPELVTYRSRRAASSSETGSVPR